jgi:transposase-like protein
MENQEVKTKARSPWGHYSVAFKKRVVQEYAQGHLTKEELRAKYKIPGHSSILNWCRRFGKLHYIEKSTQGRPMKDAQKQRIKELEKQLKEAQLKVIAYETLIEVIKQEDGIDLLKKDGAKQSVSSTKPAHEA